MNTRALALTSVLIASLFFSAPTSVDAKGSKKPSSAYSGYTDGELKKLEKQAIRDKNQKEKIWLENEIQTPKTASDFEKFKAAEEKLKRIREEIKRRNKEQSTSRREGRGSQKDVIIVDKPDVDGLYGIDVSTIA